MLSRSHIALLTTLVAFSCLPLGAQTRADYERALALRETLPGLVVNAPGPASWIGDTHRFVYRKSVKDGHQFVVVDAETTLKRPAFDHAAVADALSKGGIRGVTPTRLPFSEVRFTENEQAITFSAQDARWTCTLATPPTCTRRDEPAPLAGILRGVNGPVRGAHSPSPTDPRTSPDGKWEAIILNHNIAIRPASGGKPTPLSTDGVEGDGYELASITWSPDSSKLAAYRVRAGHRRTVHYVESSPEDQLQPRPVDAAVRETRGRARSRAAIHLPRRAPPADRGVERPLPEPIRAVAAGVAQGRARADVRVQPARPPGLPRHRGRCHDREGTLRAVGGAANVLLLQRLE